MAEANIWCWLIPVLIGIVSGVLGYFWGKSNGSSADPALTDSLLGMEQETSALKQKSEITSIESENWKGNWILKNQQLHRAVVRNQKRKRLKKHSHLQKTPC